MKRKKNITAYEKNLRIKRIIILAAFTFVFAFIFNGIRTSDSSEPISFGDFWNAQWMPERGSMPDRDWMGNPVEIPAQIERIVSLSAFHTETLIALNLVENIVAVDSISYKNPDLASDVLRLDKNNIDFNALLALKPDIIFAVDGLCLDKAREAGIPVWYKTARTSIEIMISEILHIGCIVDKWDAGVDFANDSLFSLINGILDIGQPYGGALFYVEIDCVPPFISAATGTLYNQLLSWFFSSGNIFFDFPGVAQVTEEQIFYRNPDFIFTLSNRWDDPVEEIVSRPGWESLPAVQSGNVYFIKTGASYRPIYNVQFFLSQLLPLIWQ